ncbi:hypothetical protein ACQZV8_20120, partial [Magnetococcales bacterium HHB-1]
RRRLKNPIAQLGATTAMAFSPWFWEYKDFITTEIPFMFFLFAALLTSDRFIQRHHQASSSTLPYHEALLTGFICYLAYLTRNIGGIIIPALALSWALHHYRQTQQPLLKIWQPLKHHIPLIIALILFVLLHRIQNILLSSDAAYYNALAQFHPDFILLNIKRYLFWYPLAFWYNTVTVTGQGIIFILSTLLTLIGVIRSLKNPTTGEFFALIYLPILFLLPFNDGERYLYPLIPLYLFYMFRGAEVFSAWIAPKKAALIPATLFLLIGWTYVNVYLNMEYTPFQEGVGQKEAQETFQFIREQTPKESIILFRKHRAVALYTQRKTLSMHQTKSREAFLHFLKKINATHLMIKYSQIPNTAHTPKKDPKAWDIQNLTNGQDWREPLVQWFHELFAHRDIYHRSRKYMSINHELQIQADWIKDKRTLVFENRFYRIYQLNLE